MKWLLLLFGILTNAGASMLVKWAGSSPMRFDMPFAPANMRFAFAILLYFAAFLLYAAAVTRMPLAVAHPIMTAGAIVLVGLSAVFLFHERVGGLQAAGYLLLLLGIGCIALSQRPVA